MLDITHNARLNGSVDGKVNVILLLTFQTACDHIHSFKIGIYNISAVHGMAILTDTVD